MEFKLCSFTFYIFLTHMTCQNSNEEEPEQIHISYGDGLDEMFVTWNTLQATTIPMVRYGIKGIEEDVMVGYTKNYTIWSEEERTIYVHRVRLTALVQGTRYHYCCGTFLHWSPTFNFTTRIAGASWIPRIALFGDLGLIKQRIMSRLIEETENDTYDAVIHMGDFAYDLDGCSGNTGDLFMRMIQPVAARVPYMTCAGSREHSSNFSHYRHRFTMPHGNDNFFYSFDIGPAHVIAISTEFYYTLHYGFSQVLTQYNWLEKDLQEANKPENRAKRPWIITYGHRPMYCSSNDKDDCTSEHAWIRVGVPFFSLPGLEILFYKYGVDLQMWAHTHFYERTYPIFNDTAFNSSTDDPYVQPRAPVHVISGLAGCKKPRDRFKENPKAWSALRASNFSHTVLTIHNSSHLHIQQVPDTQTGEVLDDFWIVQDQHGPFNERCWD